MTGDGWIRAVDGNVEELAHFCIPLRKSACEYVLYVCNRERFERVICHLCGFKLCQGHMLHCRAAETNDKYVNAFCEVYRVHHQHVPTSNRQMADDPVYIRSKSRQATSALTVCSNILHITEHC